MTENNIVWKNSHFMNSSKIYSKMVSLLTHELRYTVELSNKMDSTEVDTFSNCIVNILNCTGGTMKLIVELLKAEFESTSKKLKGALLRGNSSLSKVESAFVRNLQVAGEYLRLCIGDLVMQIVHDPELQLEIDPRRLAKQYSVEESEIEEMIINNRVLLRDLAQTLLNRISSPQMIQAMPREVREIARRTREYAEKHAPESVIPLVGGFIMLRYFCPALVTPENYGILVGDQVPSIKARRNLVLLAKLIQNTSNNVLFGSKEDYMLSMNPFIEQNTKQMFHYLSNVSAPNQSNNNDHNLSISSSSSFSLSSSISSSMELNNNHDNNVSGNGNSGEVNNESYSSWYTVSLKMDIRDVALRDLFELHRLIKLYSSHLIEFVNRNQDLNMKEECLNLLEELGPAPFVIKRKTQTVSGMSGLCASSDQISFGMSSITHNPSPSLIDISALEAAHFLYSGSKTKEGNPIIWIIANRIKLEYLANIDSLISLIYKVMGEVGDGQQRYAVVVDMSWTNLSSEMKQTIFNIAPKLAQTFSWSYKKNLAAVYIVHPTSYTRALLVFLRGFVSYKLRQKIHEIYNWKELQSFIHTDLMLLPEDSKHFITKAFTVNKINARGRSQQRLIKLTPDSLLNIEPKTKRIQNEKLFQEIDELIASFDSNEITLKFSTSTKEERRKSYIRDEGSFFFPKDATDLVQRRYLFNTKQERDDLLSDFFEANFHLQFTNQDSYSMKQNSKNINEENCFEFMVTKINEVGKAQERIFKLSCDSLLNLDSNQVIRSEISFAGIEDVTLDPERNEIVWLKYKAEESRRKIICKNERDGMSLVRSLSDAIRQHQIDNEYETNQDVSRIRFDQF